MHPGGFSGGGIQKPFVFEWYRMGPGAEAVRG